MPSDEVYEKAVNMATVIYQLEGEAEKTQFVPIHENSAKMLQVSILHPTKVSRFVTTRTQVVHKYLNITTLVLQNKRAPSLFVWSHTYVHTHAR